MTCQEAIAILADYLEASCGPDLLAGLEAHFADCEPCRAYLATYRKTRDLAAAANRVEMPDEMKRRLRELLLAQLRQGG